MFGYFSILHIAIGLEIRIIVESRLYVQVGTEKFGRRTDNERDVSENNLLYSAMCKVFWMRLHLLDVQRSGTYN